MIGRGSSGISFLCLMYHMQQTKIKNDHPSGISISKPCVFHFDALSALKHGQREPGFSDQVRNVKWELCRRHHLDARFCLLSPYFKTLSFLLHSSSKNPARAFFSSNCHLNGFRVLKRWMKLRAPKHIVGCWIVFSCSAHTCGVQNFQCVYVYAPFFP